MFFIGPNGEPMLVVQGEDFHPQLLPTFIETALQILREASMISSHDIPEIILGRNTLTQTLPVGKQVSTTKHHFLYPGKVVAYTKNLNQKHLLTNSKKSRRVLVAISDTGHHRIIICTLDGYVKVCNKYLVIGV